MKSQTPTKKTTEIRILSMQDLERVSGGLNPQPLPPSPPSPPSAKKRF